MKYFFVIGNKASQSLSPLIFNHWFKKYKINAKYKFVETKEVNFDDVLTKLLQNKKTHGLNITIPFKKKIIKFLDVKNIHAKKIGAVNCITVRKKIFGTNTDWIGYLGSIRKKKLRKDKKILILGYGGASQAIFYGLSVKGFKNIIVFNRSKKAIKAGGVKKFSKKYSQIDKHIKNADLIINTTPTNPLTKKQIKTINKSTLISDIVYKPKETAFLKNFKENEKIFGISMLIEQAKPCFYQWFGFSPVIDEVLLKKLNTKIK
ncbi:shikimate dehydrogenase [Pelagibacterales bacterium SAG-MED31]|nr:shikimate dehydrogenase [Pelagibacterales bacterium SAG-MED31]